LFQAFEVGVWVEFARNRSGGLFGITPPTDKPWRVFHLETGNQLGFMVFQGHVMVDAQRVLVL
jgi:hypothetical protein